MLLLRRKIGQKILIGENITIQITAVEGGIVQIGIEAPRDIPVWRQELLPLKPELAPSVSPPLERNESAAKLSREEWFIRARAQGGQS